MIQADRDRVVKLASTGTPVKSIAERLGLTYDQTRRVVERAEKSGELPAGTLAKCSPSARKSQPKPAAEEPAPPSLTVFAPVRSHAATMGQCSACSAATEIVVQITKGQSRSEFRLCRLHAPDLASSIEAALAQASTQRMRFNGRSKVTV